MEQQPEQQKPQQPQPQVAPAKKSDDKTLKILFFAVVFVLLASIIVLVQFIPGCKVRCKNAMAMLETVFVPIMAAVAIIASGVLFRKMKKLPEKKEETDSYANEVPPLAFVKILMMSYSISLLINVIVGGIFSANLRGSCENAASALCVNGVVVPYFVAVFPLTLVGSTIAGYKLSYLLLVPLVEVGTFPNGKKIMKRDTPKQVKWLVMGAAVLAALIVLVITIIFIKSI